MRAHGPPVLLCNHADGFIDADIQFRADLGTEHIQTASSVIFFILWNILADDTWHCLTESLRNDKQRERGGLLVCLSLFQLPLPQSLNSRRLFCCRGCKKFRRSSKFFFPHFHLVCENSRQIFRAPFALSSVNFLCCAPRCVLTGAEKALQKIL